MARSGVLQEFLDAAVAAFDERVFDPQGRRSVEQIFAALETTTSERVDIGKRLPVCDQYLDEAVSAGGAAGVLDVLIAKFKALEPLLEWRLRPGNDGTASGNFATGHANAMIIGPGGLEDRRDVWLGISLLAPGVRYPDHDHVPEETYLVLSEGEFMHGESGWFSPGVGGSFYNPPGIRHAMRSGEKPLLAFWALLPDQTKH